MRVIVLQALFLILASGLVGGTTNLPHGRSAQPLRNAHATAAFLRLKLTTTAATTQGRGGEGSMVEGSTVAEVVASIEEIVAMLDGWQKNSKDRAAAYESNCTANTKLLGKLIKNGEKTIQESTADLEAISADVAGIKTDIESQKESIKATSGEIDQLVSELKAMRDAETQENSESTAALQQVDTAITKASQQEHMARVSDGARAARLGSVLQSKVSELDALGSQLQAAEDSPAVALVQTGAQTRRQLHHRHKSRSRKSLRGEHRQGEGEEVKVLQQDKNALMEAVDSAEEDFDEKEKENLELTRIKREELKKLEAGLRDLQPALADKLKREAETNRTLLSAERGIARDEALLATDTAVCPTLASMAAAESDARFKLSGVLRMATKTLEAMDATVFLARDLKELEPTAQPHRFQRRHRRLAMHRAKASTPAALAFVQVASQQLSSTAAAPTGSGPFADVSAMIEALIAQLEEQGASDTDRDQFCTEAVAKNRASRQKEEDALSVVKSQILFTEAAIARLNEEIAYFEEEAGVLDEAAAESTKALKNEAEQRDAEDADMQTALTVITKAADVLVELCDLSSSTPITEPSFLAANANGSAAHVKKGTQCQLAKEFLDEASGLMEQGGQARSQNKGKIESLFGDISSKAQSDADDRAADLLAAREALARRVDELAAAKADVEVKNKDLALIATAQKELETNCGPKQETHEERMQRRAEEIEALKNALQVLGGESAPAGSDE